MIICNDATGQLSNRLCVAQHALALAIERKETIVFTELDFAKRLYKCTPPSGIKVIFKKSWFWRFERQTIGRMVDWMIARMPPAAGDRNRCLRAFGLTIVSGWAQLRADRACWKHHDEICAFFRPKFLDERKDAVESLLSRTKPNVGIHIRRRDYRDWNGGKYFFSDDVYARIMRDIEKEIDAHFIVFHDEPVEMEHYKGLDCVCSNGTPVEDHWFMSKCDYLVGPPSTFTGWASFYGKVPVATITSPTVRLSLKDLVQRMGRPDCSVSGSSKVFPGK